MIAHDFSDGEAAFGLTYDGIYLYNPDLFSSQIWLKIPVAGHEDLVNMDYFGKTPDVYTLFFDVDQTLSKDVTGDGKADVLKVSFEEYTKDGYDFPSAKLVIGINGQTYEFTDPADNDLTANFERAFLVFDGNNYNLYCTCKATDAEEDTYVYRLNGENEPEFCGFIGEFIEDKYYMDPSFCNTYYRSFMLSYHLNYMPVSLTQGDGLPTHLSEYYTSYAPGPISKQELAGVMADFLGKPTDKKVTVPAETIVTPPDTVVVDKAVSVAPFVRTIVSATLIGEITG
jgi:hypothetical protein